MDVITDIVGTMRAAGAADTHVFRRSGAWSLPFPAVNGAGFHVVRDGAGWLITPHRPPVRVRAGDIVFSPYGAEHGFSDRPRPVGSSSASGPEDPGPADFELVCGGYLLNRGRVHPYLRSLPDAIVISPGHRDPALRSLADLMCEGVHTAALPSLVDLVLVQGLHHVRDQLASPEVPEVADAAIAAVLRAVHSDLDGPWTVDRLSAVASLPRGAFAQRFADLVGEPPMTYVINRRMSHAAGLLRTTREPLAAIARQTGYASEFAFASAFRRRFGIAPGRYRQGATNRA